MNAREIEIWEWWKAKGEIRIIQKQKEHNQKTKLSSLLI